MQQSVGGLGCSGQAEVVFGCDPGLQSLRLPGGSVSGHVTQQVALELVRQEVEVDRRGGAAAHVPETQSEHKSKMRTTSERWSQQSWVWNQRRLFQHNKAEALKDSFDEVFSD